MKISTVEEVIQLSVPYYIQQLVNSVDSNTSVRYNCPVCHGENTFSITKESGMAKWNCFKASCSLRGKDTYLDSVYSLKARLEGHTEEKEEFLLPDYLIYGLSSEKCSTMLLNNNCFIPYQKGLFNVMYDPAQDRVCFLVKKNNKIVGMIGRAVKSKTKPKVLNYKGSNKHTPFIVGNSQTLVLVEDCLSAASVTRIEGLSGMALLGTQLKLDYIPVLKNYSTIIVALDKDAFKKAVDLRKSLMYYHSDVKLWRLEKDIKNLSDKELVESYVHV